MFGLGMLKGLAVTMRHFVESFAYDRKPWEWFTVDRYSQEWLDKRQDINGKGLFTIQYPEQQRKIAEHFRFLPMLVYEETPEEMRCTACGICARVCPPQCIWIERATDARGRPKAKPAAFWIDATICMSCGFCAEFCPFNAIKMNQKHEMLTKDRDRDLFLSLEKLLVPVEYYATLHPSDYAREEKARHAKEEAKRLAEEQRTAVVAKKEETKKPQGAQERAVSQEIVSAEPDDLRCIEGIGPKIAGILKAAGIATFAQLAEIEPERVAAILQEADPRLLRIANPETWPQQAKLAAAGKWEALEKWQAQLKGGRKA